MARARLLSWWCYLNHQNSGELRFCGECGAPRIESHAQIHTRERAVVYRNPATGAHITPARADQPMPEIYARQGFERHEILSMTNWEREAGVVHEATNFHPGNEPAPTADPAPPVMSREVKESLIDDMRQAFASGPFTGGDILE